MRSAWNEILRGNLGALAACEVSPDGACLLVVQPEGTVSVYELRTGVMVRSRRLVAEVALPVRICHLVESSAVVVSMGSQLWRWAYRDDVLAGPFCGFPVRSALGCTVDRRYAVAWWRSHGYRRNARLVELRWDLAAEPAGPALRKEHRITRYQTADFGGVAAGSPGARQWIAVGGPRRVHLLPQAFEREHTRILGPTRAMLAPMQFDETGRYLLCLQRQSGKLLAIDIEAGECGTRVPLAVAGWPMPPPLETEEDPLHWIRFAAGATHAIARSRSGALLRWIAG